MSRFTVRHSFSVLGIIALATGSLFSGAVPSAQAAEARFAYVDTPKAIANSEPAKRAREILQRMLEEKQRTLTYREDELKRMRDDLENKKSLMSPEAQTDLAEKFRSKSLEFQRLLEDNQRVLDKENAMWTQKITRGLHKAIEEIGKEKGFGIIFGKGQVLYNSSSVDITDQVTERLNSQRDLLSGR
ncbi:MAG: OmpH family outer membrane protein [Magnetococcales bacterium]|nr:OmpH family outer membrane protein [Magnetococcales bacterium]